MFIGKNRLSSGMATWALAVPFCTVPWTDRPASVKVTRPSLTLPAGLLTCAVSVTRADRFNRLGVMCRVVTWMVVAAGAMGGGGEGETTIVVTDAVRAAGVGLMSFGGVAVAVSFTVAPAGADTVPMIV